ncbi:MAG: aspartate--tRNA ligase [Candidatus Paceibacterota bacterium]
MKTWIKDIVNKVDETVPLSGWVSNRRDHGKLIFIDLRDRSGVCQVVFGPWSGEDIYAQAQKLRSEWVIQIQGFIKKRPENMINPELSTGTVEVDVKELIIINESQTPPFPLEGDGYEIDEEVRMKYKYLDLRRPRLQKNLGIRHRVIKFIRDYLDTEGFYEVETPILTKSTPEGARDYVVPSRLYTGSFYALPQSPQQYKQLLMASGVEKYFQIARCFRDEDTRGDRQPEFTQMDLEMSFVEREDVMQLNEKLLITLVQTVFPEKKIQQVPFPRITYKEAMEKYGTDRPDLRENQEDKNLLAFCWVVDFPFFEKTEEGGWTFTHNPFSQPKPEHLELLMQKERIGDILTTQYDIALNGFEIGGGSIRAHNPQVLSRVFEIMGYGSETIQKNFGHMLEAFSYGTPSHGGIAWGLDRLLAILQNEPNIREVIPFPKTGDARDLMMSAPSELDPKQLQELHIDIRTKKV